MNIPLVRQAENEIHPVSVIRCSGRGHTPESDQRGRRLDQLAGGIEMLDDITRHDGIEATAPDQGGKVGADGRTEERDGR